MTSCGWLAYHTGGCWPTSQPTGIYNELSGFLSIALPPLITLAGVAILWAWHHNCHRKRCWRIGRHLDSGTHWCRRHHPAGRLLQAKREGP